MRLAGKIGDTNKSQRSGAEAWGPSIHAQQNSVMTVATYCRDRGVTGGFSLHLETKISSCIAIAAEAFYAPLTTEGDHFQKSPVKIANSGKDNRCARLPKCTAPIAKTVAMFATRLRIAMPMSWPDAGRQFAICTRRPTPWRVCLF
jgi:hypothetical protein